MTAMQHETGTLQAVKWGNLCDIVLPDGTTIAHEMLPADAELLVDRHNKYARVLALNRELLEACDYVLQNNSASLTSGTKEKLRIVLAKAEKESP